jgi:hypothetical protein
MKAVYGTLAQLALYRPDMLIPKQKEHFQKRTRLVLTGEKLWGTMKRAPGGGSHTVETHKLLEEAGIRHHYDNSLEFKHSWNKEWMGPTLAALMALTEKG